MGKDPAVLWYFGDWGGGTRTFTRHQKGCYMDLLEAQYNSGPLSLEEIKTVLGSDFGLHWPAIQKKFKADEKSGLFCNERMELEKAKRKNYVQSRKSNLSKKTLHMDDHMSPHMDTHMDAHMENENEDRNINKEGIVKGRSLFSRPTLDQIRAYCMERGNSVDAQRFLDYYESNGWKVGKNSMKNWQAAVRTWERNPREFNTKNPGIDRLKSLLISRGEDEIT